MAISLTRLEPNPSREKPTIKVGLAGKRLLFICRVRRDGENEVTLLRAKVILNVFVLVHHIEKRHLASGAENPISVFVLVVFKRLRKDGGIADLAVLAKR